jgi:chemotaxis protein MotD
LLDDTAPPPEPGQSPPESKASAGGGMQAPAKSKDGKAPAPTDDAKTATTKSDDVARVDDKPANEAKPEEDTKKAVDAKTAGNAGESINPDQEQKPASENKTDVATGAAPTNDSATQVASADVTAIVPVPTQTSTVISDDQVEQPLQQLTLAADTKPQVHQLDPDIPKVLAKKTDDGKPADTVEKIEPDQSTGQPQDALQLQSKDAPSQHAEAKPQADLKEGDKQRGPQGHGDVAPNSHRPDVSGPTAPGADIATAKMSADTTAQLPIPGTSAQSTASTAAPAATAAQPMPQPVAIPLSGVAIEIAGKALAGKNRFEIRLDPPELGRIDVRLDVDRDGNVTSRLTVDRPDTLDLLRRDVTGLERALQDAGLKTANNGLQFSLRDQSLNEQQTGRSDAALMVANDEVLPSVDVIPQRYGRLAGQGGGLDIRV